MAQALLTINVHPYNRDKLVTILIKRLHIVEVLVGSGDIFAIVEKATPKEIEDYVNSFIRRQPGVTDVIVKHMEEPNQ